MIDIINNFCDIFTINNVGWNSINLDINDVHHINYLLLVFTATFVYCGYAESNIDYAKICNISIGKITEILLEENRDSSLTNIIYGINTYSNKELYRIKVIYEYKIKDNKYTGYFYNDTTNSNYESLDKIKKYWNYYKANPYIKIYYLKYNNLVSNVDILNIKNNNINFYYRWGLTIFILLMIFLIFSIFFIIAQ